MLFYRCQYRLALICFLTGHTDTSRLFLFLIVGDSIPYDRLYQFFVRLLLPVQYSDNRPQPSPFSSTFHPNLAYKLFPAPLVQAPTAATTSATISNPRPKPRKSRDSDSSGGGLDRPAKRSRPDGIDAGPDAAGGLRGPVSPALGRLVGAGCSGVSGFFDSRLDSHITR
jgi:hypothetical protein